MFGFVKGVAYRTDCSDIIQDMVLDKFNIGKQSCVEFVEDHKQFFDGAKEKGYKPGAAVVFIAQQVLFAIAENRHDQLRSFNNCKHTEVICLAICMMLLETNMDKDERKELETAIETIEKRNNELIDALSDAFPEQMDKLENISQDKAVLKTEDETVKNKTKKQSNETMRENNKTKIIQTPNRAYFDRKFIVQYEVERGETVLAGNLILKLIDPKETIGISAISDSVLMRTFVNDGERVDRSQVNLCEIFEGQLNNRNLGESEWKHLNKSDAEKSQPNIATADIDIESRLTKLKDLYKKKLISKSTYEERQAEIVQEL